MKSKLVTTALAQSRKTRRGGGGGKVCKAEQQALFSSTPNSLRGNRNQDKCAMQQALSPTTTTSFFVLSYSIQQSIPTEAIAPLPLLGALLRTASSQVRARMRSHPAASTRERKKERKKPLRRTTPMMCGNRFGL